MDDLDVRADEWQLEGLEDEAWTESAREQVAEHITENFPSVPEADALVAAGVHALSGQPADLGDPDGLSRNAEAWLGHTDPAFTLRVYVHLMDDGLGDADFFDRWSHGAASGAAQATAPQANDEAANPAESAI